MKKIDLMEAKKILNSDKVFLNKDSFNYLNIGKYASRCTFVIPQEWNLDCNGKPESPIRYQEVPELTDNMNIDFDGRAKVLFGIYHLSQAGKPVFKITTPDKAQDILVCVSWGGAFNSSRGYRTLHKPEIGEKYFLRSSSNGGGVGVDYWVFPVGFVYNCNNNDVSAILKRVAEEENNRIKNNESVFIEKETTRLISIEKGKEILSDCRKMVDHINELRQKYGQKYEVEFETECMRVHYKKVPYTEAYEYLKGELNETLAMISHREEYTEILKQASNDVISLGGSFKYDDINQITIKFGNDYYGRLFNCNSLPNIKAMMDYIKEEKERQEKEKALIIENMIKAKKEQELKEAKKAAKEAGCPEIFTYWNRIGGATGQSHAYVIRPDGSIRIPDDNILRNSNHRHQNNWLEYADGEQVYNQILIGELIISYKKECTNAPIRIFIEWKPESISGAQKETVNEIYNNLQRQYQDPQFVDEYDNSILSGDEWLLSRV